MAFGGSGPVFLGDDMMQSKEYSEEVASLIDEEIQRVLVDQESRCRQLLTDNRKALNLIARGLLEHETLSGDEVNRLIRVANGEDDGVSATDGVADGAAPAEESEEAVDPVSTPSGVLDS